MEENAENKKISHGEIALLDRTQEITNEMLGDIDNLFKYNTEIDKYLDAFSEVDYVLDNLDEVDRENIPQNIIELVKSKKNPNYIFTYDTCVKFEKQVFLPETIIILSFINMNYLLGEEQKAFLEKMHAFYDTKALTEKDVKENPKNIFDKNIEILLDENSEFDGEICSEETALVEVKKNFFTRIIEKIKSICQGISLFNN